MMLVICSCNLEFRCGLSNSSTQLQFGNMIICCYFKGQKESITGSLSKFVDFLALFKQSSRWTIKGKWGLCFKTKQKLYILMLV